MTRSSAARAGACAYECSTDSNRVGCGEAIWRRGVRHAPYNGGPNQPLLGDDTIELSEAIIGRRAGRRYPEEAIDERTILLLINAALIQRKTGGRTGGVICAAPREGRSSYAAR